MSAVSTHRLGLVCLLLLTGALSGCGILFTKGPPPGAEQMQSFTCTTENTAAIVDVVVASLNLFGTLIIAGDPQSYGYEDASAPVASGVLWTGVLGASAAVGFNRVNKCRAALAELAERLAHAPGSSAGTVASPGAPIDSVIVNPPASSIKVGESVQLQANAYTSGGARVSAPALKWSSSDNAVAWVVSKSGLVTALAPGRVVIAASAPDVVGTATVVVVAPNP